MKTPIQLFDQLDKWYEATNQELDDVLTSKSCLTTLELIADLLLAASSYSHPKNVDEFVNVVNQLKMTKKSASRKLGDALLVASQYIDKKDTKSAKIIYENFIESCDAKFYTSIAKHQLDELNRTG